MAPPPAGDTEPDVTARADRLMRREPPRFRRVAVEAVESLSPHLLRVRLGGPELEGLAVDEPAASVRVLLPPAGGDLVLPTWDGNEFLLPDGSRPPIRTLTPRRLHDDGPALDVDVVLHEGGVASEWAAGARTGDAAAVSGTGRGFDIDPAVPSYLLAGDESAIPAISQLLEWMPDDVPVDIHIEVARPDARVELPSGPRATVTWHDLPAGRSHGDALVAAVEAAEIPDGAHVWVAGEAASVQRIRRHLADDRQIPRSRATVRGYWKRGRPAS